jgi:hypothetical protein
MHQNLNLLPTHQVSHEDDVEFGYALEMGGVGDELGAFTEDCGGGMDGIGWLQPILAQNLRCLKKYLV